MRVIGDIARLNAKRNPNKKALIMGEDSLTYGQLNQMANQLAHGLLSKGVSPGRQNCCPGPQLFGGCGH